MPYPEDGAGYTRRSPWLDKAIEAEGVQRPSAQAEAGSGLVGNHLNEMMNQMGEAAARQKTPAMEMGRRYPTTEAAGPDLAKQAAAVKEITDQIAGPGPGGSSLRNEVAGPNFPGE